MRLTVQVRNEDELLSVMRQYGKRGWTSGEIPAGGLVLPLSMADTFDWSLIGAREFLSQEGEKCVFHKGQVYKRRELEEVDTKKLRAPQNRQILPWGTPHRPRAPQRR
ncbi:single-stranded DNA-binding protein [Deinococcus roseus]|uniref:single-stranded DNA-binding protein n=1 Tax=Deinococcus roseus TaxID=392414 RepID=UPI001669D101|nr:single-stranded DNA-binding protein [Deinococcus roseus]